ncbi:MAG TPA: hypothetical protein VHM24_07750, partial [Gemmatimonadaceae bacterium]|nr:hypothetical protein [Gemmatimonadaceae bacterium]
ASELLDRRIRRDVELTGIAFTDNVLGAPAFAALRRAERLRDGGDVVATRRGAVVLPLAADSFCVVVDRASARCPVAEVSGTGLPLGTGAAVAASVSVSTGDAVSWFAVITARVSELSWARISGVRSVLSSQAPSAGSAIPIMRASIRLRGGVFIRSIPYAEGAAPRSANPVAGHFRERTRARRAAVHQCAR